MKNIKLVYLVNKIDESHCSLFDELYQKLGNSFKVVTFEEANSKITITGKTIFERPYSIIFSQSKNFIYRIMLETNAIVVANCPFYIKKYAMKMKDKLVLVEGERTYKKKYHLLGKIRVKIGMFFHYRLYQRDKLYWLAIGSYVCTDLAKNNLFKEKVLKWGYFPRLAADKNEIVFSKKEDTIRFVWIGQLIEIKRPQLAILIAKMVADYGFNVCLDFYGDGILKDELSKKYTNSKVENLHISYHGRVPLFEIKNALINSNYYLSTSDFHDGWCMVLNQSLECGCIPISHFEVGGSLSMIEDGENGFLFDDKVDYLVSKIIRNFSSQSDYVKMKKKARETYDMIWNPNNAADCLIKTITSIENNNAIDCMTGLCSKCLCVNKKGC